MNTRSQDNDNEARKDLKTGWQQPGGFASRAKPNNKRNDLTLHDFVEKPSPFEGQVPRAVILAAD